MTRTFYLVRRLANISKIDWAVIVLAAVSVSCLVAMLIGIDDYLVDAAAAILLGLSASLAIGIVGTRALINSQPGEGED